MFATLSPHLIRDVNHGKIEDDFAEFFQNKARGTNYELIYNRYSRDTVVRKSA